MSFGILSKAVLDQVFQTPNSNLEIEGSQHGKAIPAMKLIYFIETNFSSSRYI